MLTKPTLEELERYFQQAKLPGEIQLYPGIRVTDMRLFVTSQLSLIRRFGDSPYGKSYRERLLRLKELLDSPTPDSPKA